MLYNISYSIATESPSLYHLVETAFTEILRYIILTVEAIGCAVLVYAVFRALLGWIGKKEHLRRILAEGLILALEFKVGAELLRTVTVRSIEELLTLGAVILLRAALNLLLEWEIRSEEKHERLARDSSSPQ